MSTTDNIRGDVVDDTRYCSVLMTMIIHKDKEDYDTMLIKKITLTRTKNRKN